MARVKKAVKKLSPEEKLQQALVPVEEQPYPIPENWCWTRLGNITEVVGGGTPSSKVEEYYKNGNIPWISPADLSGYNDIYISYGAKNITKLGLEKSSAQLMPPGTVCLSSRAPIGYVAIAKNELCTNQGFKSFLPALCYIPEYLYWYLKGNKELLESYASGTTFLELSGSKASLVEFPLAPLIEQRRIVDRIESLFAKLDEAKEKAQAVMDGFELRKSAILHKAFTGELTERWRKEHGVGIDSWKTKRINEITRARAGYAFDSKKFTNTGYQIIRMGNLYGGELDLSRNPVFISLNDIDETALKRALVNSGDILITLTGTKYKRDYGYAVSIIDPTNLLVNQRILCLTPSQDVERNYILYYLRSNIFRDIFFSNETGGVNQGNVSSKFVENIEIKVPLLAEQHEIVTILDRVMDKEQHSKEAAEAVLSQIDTMKKAILARAFRGELGTNDPAEEWAGELVREILKTEVPTQPRAKAVFIPEELEKRLESELERKIIKLYLKSDSATLSIDVLMVVSSKKFEVMDALRNLEKRRIIKKLNNGNYSLVR